MNNNLLVMKKLLLVLSVILGVSLESQAQVYVSPNSYIFVNDQFVYVKQDVNLDSNANFYLRNQSQLLQGVSGSGSNTGLGELSVFQEGTVNNFQYNYWCSPVGAPSGSVGNSNFSITQINQPTGLITSSDATILPASNYDGVANPLQISSRWIYKFIASDEYSEWVYVGNAADLGPGEGFSMKGTGGTDTTVADTNDGIQNNVGSAQRYDFAGKPNDGDISIPVLTNNRTLIGNPYPSTIDLNLFLNDPGNAAVIDGAAYFWEHNITDTHVLNQYEGGYGTYTPLAGYVPADFRAYDGAGNDAGSTGNTGNSYERRFSPVGQGFKVVGIADGNVVMKNSFRVYVKEGAINLSEFARTNGQNNEPEYLPAIPNVAGIDYTLQKKGYAPQIRINATYNDLGIRPTCLVFSENATDQFDRAADAHFAGQSDIEFYYTIEGTQEELVTCAVAFDLDKRIPVGFRCNQTSNFKLAVDSVKYGFDPDQVVYLYDSNTGIYHDIKNDVFDMTLPVGDHRNRFEITFKTSDEDSLEAQALLDQSISVYQDNQLGQLILSNPSKIELESMKLYDIAGKLMLNKFSLGSESLYQVNTSNLSDGIYVVKITDQNGVSFEKNLPIKRN